ncbi:DUF6233 domain-containing protein [Streptomyces cavernae]|uniref:DUF6233 domain-containing protein n=1 Tax=Streptomyces cavernae TaxID=2259034 RepID=UPI000FEBFB67|nr:DUF6233 domain-containing protein [Streptomyces cavernae]
MSELPPDPHRLRALLAHLDAELAANRTVATYLRLQRDAVRQALAAAGRKQSPPRQAASPPTENSTPGNVDGYLLEPKRHPTAPQPAQIHLAKCAMPQRDTAPISEEEARLALADRAQPKVMEACQFCRPDTALGLAD